MVAAWRGLEAESLPRVWVCLSGLLASAVQDPAACALLRAGHTGLPALVAALGALAHVFGSTLDPGQAFQQWCARAGVCVCVCARVCVSCACFVVSGSG